jgi:CYTH domain-containing protein
LSLEESSKEENIVATEIERKYLVVDESWRSRVAGTVLRQGYLSTVKERTVRIRVVGDRGYLTVKGLTVGAIRAEFEYEIPITDAEQMLNELCERPLIEKTRYVIEANGLIWEIDRFAGVNDGLVVAEVELEDEAQQIVPPEWIGAEVTHDARYFNSNLIAHPFSEWSST